MSIVEYWLVFTLGIKVWYVCLPKPLGFRSFTDIWGQRSLSREMGKAGTGARGATIPLYWGPSSLRNITKQNMDTKWYTCTGENQKMA